MEDKFGPVIVEWEDTCTTGGWTLQDGVLQEAVTPYIVQTVGFLIAWNKQRLVLAAGYALYGQYQNVMKIPRGMIRNMTYLTRRRGAPKTTGRIERSRTRKD